MKSLFSRTFLILLSLILNTAALASSRPVETIMQMLGCFSVVFNYVEDGLHDKLFEPVLERAELVATDPLVIKRTLIIDQKEQPHWSETWLELGDGSWQQHVIGPFGDERYICQGPWVHNQWDCLAQNAAKPRRDKDRPYAFLTRRNTLQITPKRWIHMQSNQKLREDGTVLSAEVGWNTYQRVDDQLCSIITKVTD